MEKRNAKALLPIAVFVVLYLGLGILFEYGLNIEMGFYKIPVVIIFLLALLVACLQNRKLSLNDKLKIMGVGISDPNIITMISYLCWLEFLWVLLEEHQQTVWHILFCH